MESNKSRLPRHLNRWLTSADQQGLLDESALNCCSCVKFFGKCCTFQPFVANFNVGSMALKQKERNYFFAPLGLFASADYHARFAHTPELQRGSDLLCVYFELSAGVCSRWDRRPAECAAYHCESGKGAAGLETWQRLSLDWNQMEYAVAQMAMIEMGFTFAEVTEQLGWIVKPPELRKTVWGHWLGREQEYFDRCADWALGLKPEQVQEWLASVEVPAN